MNDITIPADDAKELADFLRESCHRSSWTDEMADLLDPPAPSLRDEVLEIQYGSEPPGRMADAVLAVVRRHVEALRGWDGGAASMEWSIDGSWINRDDVLRLLGDSE